MMDIYISHIGITNVYFYHIRRININDAIRVSRKGVEGTDGS